MNEFYEFLSNTGSDRFGGIIVASLFDRPKCECKKEEK